MGKGDGNAGVVRSDDAERYRYKKDVGSVGMPDAVRERGNGWAKREAL